MALQLNPITGKLDLVGAGGSTSPGGAPGQLQFNSAGSFGGATTGAGVLTALGNAAGAANGFALLDGSGKITAAQLPAAVLGAMNYQGVWNANTNSPALASGVGSKGYYYKIGTAGLTSIDGLAQWNVGDLIVFNGSTWDKIDGVPSEVISVAGRTGAVTLSNADISGLGTAALVNTGTSGATVPLLNVANTFSAALTLASGGNSIPQAIFGPNNGNGFAIGMANGGSILDFFSNNSGIVGTWAQVFGIDGNGPILTSGGSLRWTNNASNVNTTIDTSHFRDAAGVHGLRGATTTSPGALSLYTYGASPPAAPAASIARLYVDTSGGKDRLVVVFSSGASQVLATQP